MIDCDERIRTALLSELDTCRSRALIEAQRVRDGGGETEASYLERQAAHYQQAIGLLKAAPMPVSEET